MGGVLPHRCFRPPWVLTWWGITPSDSLTVALLNYALLTAFGTVSCGSTGASLPFCQPESFAGSKFHNLFSDVKQRQGLIRKWPWVLIGVKAMLV